MATCKNCGKPLIPKGGKCVYCGAELSQKSCGIRENDKKLLVKKSIDIVFCIDCSWLMAPVLDSIKDNIVRLIMDINQYNKNSSSIWADWRARVIGYRNFEEDDEYLINDNQFVSTLEEIRAQLSGIVCKGCSENSPLSSSLDALWYAMQTSNWRDWDSIHYGEEYIGRRGRHGFVVLFTSAPTLTVHTKTVDEVEGACTGIDRFLENMRIKHLVLTVFAPNDPVFEVLDRVPYSEIKLFDDPIEFYYHKQLDFNSLLNSFSETLS